MAIARQLAMTTYRSEVDFDGRFGRAIQADGRFAISSYLDHQGNKLVDRFDPDTYRVLVRIMDLHDVGRGRGGIVEAFLALADAGTGLTGLGIEGDLLYGPAQVRTLVDDAAAAGVDAGYRELASTKGHDAFLTEWDQLTVIVGEALADGIERTVRRRGDAGRAAAPRNEFRTSGRASCAHELVDRGGPRRACRSPCGVCAVRRPRDMERVGPQRHVGPRRRATGRGRHGRRPGGVRQGLPVPDPAARAGPGARARRPAAGNDDHQRVRGRANAERRRGSGMRSRSRARWARSRG